MTVHQSPRRHSARLQNAYEDGTDEDEQLLLQPAVQDSQRSSPQDYHPRHTQLHAPVRTFADRQHAATDVVAGPFPDASYSTDLVGESLSGTEHADPTDLVGKAALPPSQHHSLPSHTCAAQCQAIRATQEPLEPLTTYTEADGQGRNASFTALQSTTAACRNDHRQHNPAPFDPGGGRGLSSVPSEPNDGHADRERNSAFYRTATCTLSTSAKLPPLVLTELPIPKFSGDVRTYPVFKNRFLKTVGGRSDLEPQHKFQYLLQFLDGEPLHLANGYLIANRNYFKLLGRLKGRYGDKATLAALFFQEFVNLAPAGWDVRDLRRFHDEALCLRDEMEEVGQDADGNIAWRYMLISKMPKPLRCKIHQKLGKDPLATPVQEILARLSDHVRILKKAEIALSWEDAVPPSDADSSLADDTSELSGRPCREGPEFTAVETASDVQRVAASVASTIADEQLQERRTCPLCGQLHSAADCSVYDTNNRRQRRALKLNLCLLCLREGHPAVSCPRRTTRPCNVCRRGQHNRALCKNAADANHRKDRRPSPVRATRDSRCDPEASDQQRHSRPSALVRPSRRITEQPVHREVTCCVTTATTLRQSGTQSSHERISGNLINRKKRPKNLGTDSPGRPGTNRPPTTSTDESMKQKADAYGRDRRLPGRENLLRTDMCSTNREMVQFDRTPGGGTDGVPLGGMPDEKESRELCNDEEVSHKPSDGHRTDSVADSSLDAPDETQFQPNEESNAYVACATDSDEQSAVLHDCVAVTAMNPASKKSCRAVLMFDYGSDSSHVSSKLAHFLDNTRPTPTLELPTGEPTDLVGSQRESSHEGPVCYSTDLVGDTTVYAIDESLTPLPSTSFSSGPPSSQSRVSDALPRSSQKQLFQNPLDAQLLLLPTTSTTHVQVKDVSATDLAARLQKPNEEPLSSMEAKLRCSTPPPHALGNQICALYDAGSTLKRKTRLRSCMPEQSRQHLGIYTAPEPVITVTLLLSLDSTVLFLLRAEQKRQLVLTTFSPATTVHLPLSIVQCFIVLQCSSAPSATVIDGFLQLARQRPTAIEWTRPLERSGPSTNICSSSDPCVAYRRMHAGPANNKRPSAPTSSRQLETVLASTFRSCPKLLRESC
ncbi:hypothetical protein AAVH_23288 [Aphelenchoides avenae]|nr:hypothetical protein AAVH_23288 [Aphelenchus avenae]